MHRLKFETPSGPFKLGAHPIISRLQNQGMCRLITKLMAGLLAFCVSLKHQNGDVFNEREHEVDVPEVL